MHREADPIVGPPATSVAGTHAATNALRIAVDQMGAVAASKTLLRLNQKGGVDCPGCAWPEGNKRHKAEFCENGAKAIAEEATRARADRDFWARHSVAELATWTDYELGGAGRITEPMYRAEGDTHYRPISWDAALDRIAAALKGLDSPDAAAFYTSGRTSNEAAFLYQLFVRRFGTNNLPDCSNMCHESSGSALTETIGVGKGSVLLEDFEHADLIFIVGQNPATNHPRMLNVLADASRRGATIVAVNPLKEAGLLQFKDPKRVDGVVGGGTPIASRYLQVRVNADLALFALLNKRIIAAGGVDHDFVATHTDGFDSVAGHLADLDDAELLAATGLTATEIDETVELVLASRRIIVCWAMGLTQHRNSVRTIREVVNFLLLRGNIGVPGAGVCPVRGHSNVQGDRTMGIYEKPPAAFLDALASEFNFEPPRDHGHDVVDSIRAMRDGRVRVFLSVGGNFASATPDTDVTYAALQSCELTVQVSTKPNRSHIVAGREAIILPTLGRTDKDVTAAGEQFVTVEDSMGMVHSSRGNLTPASDSLRAEVAIVADLARRVLGPLDEVPWEAFAVNYDAIRDRIANVVPGFENFNSRVREPNGFTLPHGARDSRTFATATGRARFTVNEVDAVEVPPNHLLLQTVRSHDQYNTTIYGLDDRYRGIKHGRRVVFVNPADLADLGIADGSYVDLVGEYGGVTRRASYFRVVSFDTARGCAAAYFPETNVLVPLDSTAEVSNTPTSKSIVIRLEPVPV